MILHRHDSPNQWNPLSQPNGWDTDYKAQISGDGNTLVNIAQDGKPNDAIRAAWGDALNSVPADNPDRDRRNWKAANGPSPTCDFACLTNFFNTIASGVHAANEIRNFFYPQTPQN